MAAPKYRILSAPDLAAVVEELNQVADNYVVYGGLQHLNGQFVQLVVKIDEAIVEQAAELVWDYFKESNVMVHLPNEDTAEHLMRSAEEEVVEELEGSLA